MKRAASAVFCMVLAGLLIASIPEARAQSTQVTYYIDSLAKGDGMSAIYEVQLDEVGMIANLELVVLLDETRGGPWDNADVLAATPDGERLYFINDGESGATNGQLGFYEFSTGTVTTIGIVNYLGIGFTVPGTNNTDQGSFGVDGTMYITRIDNETLYRLDLNTATATPVGLFRNAANFQPLDLQGADIAFDNTGRLFVWANEARGTAGSPDYVPRGLYSTVSATLPISGDILVNYLGTNDVFYSGLGFLNGGFGNLLGSAQEDVFVQINRISGVGVREYEPRLAGQTTTFDTHNGDMTTGALGVANFCTLTIGYWKNHDWQGATVYINDDLITEDDGRGTHRDGILWKARGNNFSMLYAQLIAAKLNCPFCVDVWTEAEAFLASAGIGEENFDARFVDKDQRRTASRLADELDAFNNAYHCDDE